MTALREAFIIGAIMCVVAAICSALRGGKYVYEQKNPQKKLRSLALSTFFSRVHVQIKKVVDFLSMRLTEL